MSKYDFDLNLKDRNSLSVLIERIKPNSVVLEFGPANGRLTKYMKEQLGCQIYAVEIDESAAKDAAQYTEKIIVDSVENYKWCEEFKDLTFDYIVFADVLEHLYYPEKALKSVRAFLKEDGSILVSIPNIAHNSIIINLMRNEFNYNSTGLLDDTHIRFFTKKNFDALIRESGYFRFFETATYINPENTEFHNSYADLPHEVSKYLTTLPYGEVYQLIYELKTYELPLVSDFSDEYKIYNRKFIQLFFDHGNGFSEETSIKLPVIHNTDIQEFIFDLSDNATIKNLRLDPLNDNCIIEIDRLQLVNKDGSEIDLMPFMQSNDRIHHGNEYFFDTDDSNIWFPNFDFSQFEGNIKGVKVNLRYAHIGQSAIAATFEQLVKDVALLQKKIELMSISSIIK